MKLRPTINVKLEGWTEGSVFWVDLVKGELTDVFGVGAVTKKPLSIGALSQDELLAVENAITEREEELGELRSLIYEQLEDFVEVIPGKTQSSHKGWEA